jgi:hypothetical protein
MLLSAGTAYPMLTYADVCRMLLAAGTAYPIGSVVISELGKKGSGDFTA